MKKTITWIWLSALFSLVLPATVPSQDLVKEALQSFPRETIRLEYSQPSVLRGLPNYASLRQQYIGPRLAKLVASLSQLGVNENDIDGLVLGWQASGGQAMTLYGFASGRFDAKGIAERATARGMSPEQVAGMPAYCLEAGLAATCVVVLEKTLGAFGSLSSLTSLLDARGGRAAAIGSNDRFAVLLKVVQTEAPIWGVALGLAVADWFKSWMPGQGNVQLDWSKVFQGVESLAYSVQAADKVNLDLKLDCSSPEAASGLRQLLEGLKLAQQLAWQNQNPGRPNPYDAVDVQLANRQVSLKLTTDYAALEGINAPTLR